MFCIFMSTYINITILRKIFTVIASLENRLFKIHILTHTDARVNSEHL